jgi:hypothetical protein
MFAPTELAIPASISKEDFQQLGAALSKVDSASDLWQCDFALHAQRTWEDEGLALAATATGLSKFFLKRCARIAERFTPEKRYPNLNRNHYRVLLPFDAAQIDAWLPTVVDQKRLSAKSLRALAVEQFGEPVSAKQQAKTCLNIRATLFARLAQHAPSRKVVALVELILEEWLKSPLESQAIVLAALELRREQHRENNRERRREAKKGAQGTNPSDDPQTDDTQTRPKKNMGPPKRVWRPFAEARDFARSLNLSSCAEWYAWREQRPADIPSSLSSYEEFAGYADFLGYPNRAERQAAREAVKCWAREQAKARKRQEREQREAAAQQARNAREVTRAAKQVAREQRAAEKEQRRRLTYEERRKAQLAAGALPIPRKGKKGPADPLRIKVLYSSVCPGPRKRGMMNIGQPTPFSTREFAEAANERRAALKGFRDGVMECEKCNAFHLRHVYDSELQRKSAQAESLSA